MKIGYYGNTMLKYCIKYGSFIRSHSLCVPDFL